MTPTEHATSVPSTGSSPVGAASGDPRVIDPSTAVEVLVHLDRELGAIDPDTRAIVALRPERAGTVALVDVQLQDNGILEVPSDAAGLVVVTAEDVSSGEEVVGLTQLVCILREGTELGIYRVAGDGDLRTWRTDEDPEDAAEDLRPRDLASNAARRAFGLPSLVEPLPVTDLAARTWLLDVATAALQRFDGDDGPTEVSPHELSRFVDRPPFDGVERREEGELPGWHELHEAAIAGKLELGGHLTVDADHAAWLDCDGFAQVVDRTLPTTEELLGSLRVTGDDELLAWAIGFLAARDWYQPA